jgi:hypothetical protein
MKVEDAMLRESLRLLVVFYLGFPFCACFFGEAVSFYE